MLIYQNLNLDSEISTTCTPLIYSNSAFCKSCDRIKSKQIEILTKSRAIRSNELLFIYFTLNNVYNKFRLFTLQVSQ